MVVAFVVTALTHGASFDTGLTPEAARDLLTPENAPAKRSDSWLRLRDMERSSVLGVDGIEVPPWPNLKSGVSVAERRAALVALRVHGYRLVAFVRWPSDNWEGGVRSDQPLRRLPLDLREAYERSRQLAVTYGDLIDYWEIENEPDISFVEENPETYAAFLKACYLGFANAKPETGNLKPEGTDESYPPTGSTTKTQVSGFRSQVSLSVRSRVLMAAFALPPGPYFDAWVANDGLRYTDGFNYHYYGYAEDFTGVYQQFEEAVTKATSPAASDEAVLQTNFYPAGNGWQVQTLSRFAVSEGSAAANQSLLRSRPLAIGEPALVENGRWLVSPGTTVKETAEGWEFTVTCPAPGPLRPAMAELPLPEGWSAPADASLAFEYRVADAAIAKGEELSAKSSDAQPSAVSRPSSNIHYPATADFRSQPSALPAAHALPIFLTEYGYGLLDKEARQTPAGREAQRAWFAAVQPQIRALRIEGPMAFILRPYLEANRNEFGLLMEPTAAGGLPSAIRPPSSVGGYAVSPALAELLAAGASPASRSWTIATPLPSSVVMDFVAGAGLQMSKSHRGYVLRADSGSASLVVYHFGAEPISGELKLMGSAWVLAAGGDMIQLTLKPGQRLEIPLTIRPASTERFGAQVAAAKFVVDASPATLPSSVVRLQSSDTSPPPPVVTPPVLALVAPPVSSQEFQVYLRAQNGNLYQTWPRSQAREVWQWYAQSLADFTPAFFGRAYTPSSLTENKQAALAFFFRPTRYPATYLIRHAQLVEYIAAKAASGK